MKQAGCKSALLTQLQVALLHVIDCALSCFECVNAGRTNTVAHARRGGKKHMIFFYNPSILSQYGPNDSRGRKMEMYEGKIQQTLFILGEESPVKRGRFLFMRRSVLWHELFSAPEGIGSVERFS